MSFILFPVLLQGSVARISCIELLDIANSRYGFSYYQKHEKPPDLRHQEVFSIGVLGRGLEYYTKLLSKSDIPTLRLEHKFLN